MPRHRLRGRRNFQREGPRRLRNPEKVFSCLLRSQEKHAERPAVEKIGPGQADGWPEGPPWRIFCPPGPPRPSPLPSPEHESKQPTPERYRPPSGESADKKSSPF